MRYDFIREQYTPKIARALSQLDWRKVERGLKPFDELTSRLFTSCQINKTEIPLHIGQAVFDIFAAKTDPSMARTNGRQAKYLDWICRSFEKNPSYPEDWYKIAENLRYFESLSARLHADGKPNQIGQVKDFNALSNLLRPYAEARDAKAAERQERHMAEEKRQQLMDETTMIYSGPEGKVVIPHTVMSARYWGNQTEWCISAHKDSENQFEKYNQDSPIVLYLPSPEASEKENKGYYSSFKFAAVDGDLYDERDQSNLTSVAQCLKRLATAVTAQWRGPAADWLRTHALTGEIAALPETSLGVLTPKAWGTHLTKMAEMLEADPMEDNESIEEYFTQNVPAKLRADKHFMRAALKIYGYVFEYAGKALKEDKDIVLAALKSCEDESVLKHADKKLLAAPDFAREACLITDRAIHAMDAAHRANETIMSRCGETSVLAEGPFRESKPFMVEIALNTHFNSTHLRRLNEELYKKEFETFNANTLLDTARTGAVNDNIADILLQKGYGLAKSAIWKGYAYFTSEQEFKGDPALKGVLESFENAFWRNRGYLSSALQIAVAHGHKDRFMKDLRYSPVVWGDFEAQTDPRAALACIHGMKK